MGKKRSRAVENRLAAVKKRNADIENFLKAPVIDMVAIEFPNRSTYLEIGIPVKLPGSQSAGQANSSLTTRLP